MLMKQPSELAVALGGDLLRRMKEIDAENIDTLQIYFEQSVATSVYATKAKALLSQPLKRRKIEADGGDWRGCGIKLYGLWQSIRPAEVERRMAELAEAGKGRWEREFPDPWVIDEAKLVALYKTGKPLEVNGIHDWSDASLALRFYVAEQLAPVANRLGGGSFDWGASDGISSIFLRHHGAKGVTVIEPNPAARAFGTWLSGQLGFGDMEFHEDRPQARKYAVGVCTEVLEHVVDPQKMMREMFEMLVPGGIVFVTSSFGVPQDTHLFQNKKFAGHEKEMMRAAGFVDCEPAKRPPVPLMPQWGFWQRPL